MRRQEELHALLERNTGLKWRCEQYRDIDYDLKRGVPKDTLYLFDVRGTLRKYYLENNKRFYEISSSLKKFAQSLNYNLVPVGKIDLDNVSPIIITQDISNRKLLITFKPSGSLVLEAASPHIALNYSLWSNISSNIQQITALNNFISDATKVDGSYDLKTNQIKLSLKKSLTVGPVTASLTAVDLKTFTGSLSFTLKKDQIIYNGWKFNGSISCEITAKNIDDDFSPNPLVVHSAKKSTVPVANNSYRTFSNIAMGGLILVGGAACFLANGACLAVIGLGGTIGYVAT